MIHWRREWQATSAFLPLEPHGQFKKKGGGQKDMKLRDKIPRLVGAQYANREDWRNSSRRNEEAKPKQK